MKMKTIVVHPICPTSHNNCKVMAIVVSHIVTIGFINDGTAITLSNGQHILVKEKYEDLLKML